MKNMGVPADSKDRPKERRERASAALRVASKSGAPLTATTIVRAVPAGDELNLHILHGHGMPPFGYSRAVTTQNSVYDKDVASIGKQGGNNCVRKKFFSRWKKRLAVVMTPSDAVCEYSPSNCYFSDAKDCRVAPRASGKIHQPKRDEQDEALRGRRVA
jgi:hypothetical protein